MAITIKHVSLFEHFSSYRLQRPQLQKERRLECRCYRLDQFLSDHLKSCLIGFGKDETLHNCYSMRTTVVFKSPRMLNWKGMRQ